jgi:hypothetical protein
MKRFVDGLFLAAACFLIIGCATQDKGKNIILDDFGIQFIEENAGFSMYAPKDWEIVDANQKYKMLMGATENNFSPNINFSDEQFSGKVSDYIDACLELFPQIFSDFKVLERNYFTANNGVQGERITTQARLNEIQVRQRMYFIQNKKNTAIMGITCTVSPAMGTKYDNIFDNCVETFEWDDKH